MGGNASLSTTGILPPSRTDTAAPQLFTARSEFAIGDKSWLELWEGGKTTVVVNRYERDPKARKACIDIFGAICSACNSDFSSKYGEIGQGYIHVHHLIRLSDRGEKYKVNPK
jgi:predicted HNH restriction endonuclease